jgi:hypothetical protein
MGNLTHEQAEAASAVAGADPVIARNAGSLGARDLHLEDFSVSNGGPNLIEDASIMMAFGRRYGLVRRRTMRSPLCVLQARSLLTAGARLLMTTGGLMTGGQ